MNKKKNSKVALNNVTLKLVFFRDDMGLYKLEIGVHFRYTYLCNLKSNLLSHIQIHKEKRLLVRLCSKTDLFFKQLVLDLYNSTLVSYFLKC